MDKNQHFIEEQGEGLPTPQDKMRSVATSKYII